MIEQRTDEWFKARLGRATGSNFGAIMAGPRYAGWKNYRAQLVIERITGKPTEGFKSGEMMWGTETEPLARLHYTLRTKHQVEETGFWPHDDIAAGASPDGLVGEEGLVEFKCPNPATHIETLRTGKVPKQYMAQVQGQMWITGRKWCDFVSFDPRMPENANIFITRVERDEAYIKELENLVRGFLIEVEEEVKFVTEYGKNEEKR